MGESRTSSVDTSAAVVDDIDMLPLVTAAVEAAGSELLRHFVPTTGVLTVRGIAEAIGRRDEQSLAILRPLLRRLRPAAGWVEDELADGPLLPGEWWVVDPVEGAINYVHGIDEWAVTATLVRDNEPMLTVVHLPLQASTYTAVRSRGAWCEGERLQVSAKVQLSAALVGTGQASPRESTDSIEMMGSSLVLMLQAAGVGRMSVPATLPLVHVAAGRMDVFWQHSAVRSGLVAGALLVQEAGGVVTDISGAPWSLHSTDFLAAAPGVHDAALRTLRGPAPTNTGIAFSEGR